MGSEKKSGYIEEESDKGFGKRREENIIVKTPDST